METRPPPLHGVVVIDLGQVYQGPYAGLLLAKAGATVIKVEPPRGEPLRVREAVGGGASLPLAMLNSNKQRGYRWHKQENKFCTVESGGGIMKG
jgi:CoA:oxalate CoA-transferase